MNYALGITRRCNRRSSLVRSIGFNSLSVSRIDWSVHGSSHRHVPLVAMRPHAMKVVRTVSMKDGSIVKDIADPLWFGGKMLPKYCNVNS